jgi:hypothetical protein
MIFNKIKKLVAVVVPLSNRNEITNDEKISLAHLVHHLGHYDKYFLVPNGLKFSANGFTNVRFDDQFFGSVDANRKLMFSKTFYKRFDRYKYILIYHLDALVFSDQLKSWCEKGYDYVGPPWVKHQEAPYAGLNIEDKVGNGGFSLRNVDSFLKVIKSKIYYIDPKVYWRVAYADKNLFVKTLNYPKKYLKYLTVFNGSRFEMARFKTNEDQFWAGRAIHYYPEFNLPTVQTALQFGFECLPRHCFELNGRRLPFGCHAWPRYDREFWEPYLMSSQAVNSMLN